MSANFLEGFATNEDPNVTVTMPRSAWDALLSFSEFMPEIGEDVDYIASSAYAAIEQVVCEHLHRERYDWSEDHSERWERLAAAMDEATPTWAQLLGNLPELFDLIPSEAEEAEIKRKVEMVLGRDISSEGITTTLQEARDKLAGRS